MGTRRGTLWWQATRPFSFPASLIPALLGGMVAVVHAGVSLHGVHYVLAAVAAAAVHAAANLLSDCFDFAQGIDREDTIGASRGMLVTGRMSPRQVLLGSLILWGASGIVALYFLWRVGPVLIPIILGGLVLGAGYTAAPSQFKYRALGDLAVFLAFGVGITLGAYVIQTGGLSWIPVAYSLPMGFLIAAILHGNNLRDIESDRRARIKTLAMLLGVRRARYAYAAMLAAAYLSVVVSVLAGWMAPVGLLCFLSVPLAVGAIRIVMAGGPSLMIIDMRTAQLQMAFGLLMILGMVGDSVFR
jgi:1,4-dihydroxy-2-naphthoate polyprenyltransferase